MLPFPLKWTTYISYSSTLCFSIFGRSLKVFKRFGSYSKSGRMSKSNCKITERKEKNNKIISPEMWHFLEFCSSLRFSIGYYFIVVIHFIQNANSRATLAFILKNTQIYMKSCNCLRQLFTSGLHTLYLSFYFPFRSVRSLKVRNWTIVCLDL